MIQTQLDLIPVPFPLTLTLLKLGGGGLRCPESKFEPIVKLEKKHQN